MKYQPKNDTNPYGNPYYVESIDTTKITNLEGLQYVSGNNYGGIYLDDNDIETVVGKLPVVNIAELSLSGNGRVTSDQLYTELQKYNRWSFTSLYLGNLGLTDLTFLEKIPNARLKTISLAGNRAADINSEKLGEYLENLYKSLETLYLSDMGLEDVEFLTKIDRTKIVVLGLDRNDIVDVSPIVECANLQTLNLANNKNIENVDGYFGATAATPLTKLRSYQLQGCNKLNSASKTYISTAANFYAGCTIFQPAGGTIQGSVTRPQSLLNIMVAPVDAVDDSEEQTTGLTENNQQETTTAADELEEDNEDLENESVEDETAIESKSSEEQSLESEVEETFKSNSSTDVNEE